MRCGGPIARKAVRQELTIRSTCKAEIRATEEAVKDILSLRHRYNDMDLPESAGTTRLYNDNQGTVDWAKGTITKGMRHINLKYCAVRDSIQAKEVDLYHIPVAINPSDICYYLRPDFEVSLEFGDPDPILGNIFTHVTRNEYIFIGPSANFA